MRQMYFMSRVCNIYIFFIVPVVCSNYTDNRIGEEKKYDQRINTERDASQTQ